MSYNKPPVDPINQIRIMCVWILIFAYSAGTAFTAMSPLFFTGLEWLMVSLVIVLALTATR